MFICICYMDKQPKIADFKLIIVCGIQNNKFTFSVK